MIFRLHILIRQQKCVKRAAIMKQHIMHYGLTNVLNYGFYFTSVFYRQIFIDQKYWPKLTECLKSIGAGDYKKNRADMFKVLYPYIDSAISNAKKLDEINSGKKPSESAPGTKVYQIIEHLRSYL